MGWCGAAPTAVLLAGIRAGIRVGLTIFGLMKLNDTTGLAWLIPSFGASCALVFVVPDSPFAKGQSIISGHLVASAAGLAALALLGRGRGRLRGSRRLWRAARCIHRPDATR